MYQGFIVVVRVTLAGGHLSCSTQRLSLWCLPWMGPPFLSHTVPLVKVRSQSVSHTRLKRALTVTWSSCHFSSYSDPPIFTFLLEAYLHLMLMLYLNSPTIRARASSPMDLATLHASDFFRWTLNLDHGQNLPSSSSSFSLDLSVLHRCCSSGFLARLIVPVNNWCKRPNRTAVLRLTRFAICVDGNCAATKIAL